MLTPEQVEQFHDSGYVVLENFKSEAELTAIKQAAADIVEEFDVEQNAHIFATGPQALDDYFLTSGDKIRCFLEEGALDGNGVLNRSKVLSINKIGHALHDLDPVFQAFSSDQRLNSLIQDLGISEPKVWQSMYIFKQPHIGGEVHWHQDATYFFTEPLSVKTLWFAVDDANLENGCLWVAKNGANSPLREVFEVRAGKAEKVILDHTPWPSLDDAVPLAVPAGTLVCFDGLLPHYSAANVSAIARHAYTLHVVDGSAHYPSTNWIQRARDFPVGGFG